MPAHQKYQDRCTTAVSLERKLHKIAKALNIEFADALAAGIQFYIRMRIADNDHRLTPELLQDFKELESKNIKELEMYIRLKTEEQKTLEMVAESKKPEETIEVFDKGEEAYIRIPVSQFDPRWHIKRAIA